MGALAAPRRRRGGESSQGCKPRRTVGRVSSAAAWPGSGVCEAKQEAPSSPWQEFPKAETGAEWQPTQAASPPPIGDLAPVTHWPPVTGLEQRPAEEKIKMTVDAREAQVASAATQLGEGVKETVDLLPPDLIQQVSILQARDEAVESA